MCLPSDLSTGAQGVGAAQASVLSLTPLPLTWQTRTVTRPRISTCAACGSSLLTITATCLVCGPHSCTTTTTTSSCCPACSSHCRTCTRRWHASCEPTALPHPVTAQSPCHRAQKSQSCKSDGHGIVGEQALGRKLVPVRLHLNYIIPGPLIAGVPYIY